MTNRIGHIVNSNSHIDYVCQLASPLERGQRPAPDAYAFGAFVAIDLPQQPAAAPAPDVPCLIGVIYNTLLVNPSFTNLGPRLTSQSEQAVFSPDLIDETAMLVGVLALGWQDAAGPQQGTPRLAAEVSADVRTLTDEEVRQFHRDAGGRLTLRYAATLLALNNPLVPALLLEIIDRLGSLFPEEQAILQVMRDNVAWKSIVRPAG
ncbi:MAG: hypothetical protein OXC27_12300 [Caldilineaceae bacterium]|nr:hypothetical protein [Caldilineaceae bacterium]